MAHTNWNDVETGRRAQFIADIVKESLFDYSFDSYKIPSLNLHFFCLDYMSTYSLVKKGIMEKGNLIPLNEEFEYILTNSLWLPDGISLSMCSFRNKFGEYQDCMKDQNLDELKKGEYYNDCANYITAFLAGKSDYSELLLLQIEKLLRGTQFDIKEQETMQFCVREYLCELVNIGINKNYIYNLSEQKLFSAATSQDDIKYIMDFLRKLEPSTREYNVVFGVTDAAQSDLGSIIKKMRPSTDKEKQFLGTKYVLETKIEDYDPYSAIEKAKNYFLVVVCGYNCFVHNEEIKIVENGFAKLQSEKKYRKVKTPTPAMKKNTVKTKNESINLLQSVLTASLPEALISSFELHNIAVNSENMETQLLMLWTILELLIETNQGTMSKVNYVTNVVSSILCNNYYMHITKGILSQITKNHSIIDVIEKETRGKNQTEKLLFILKDNTVLQQEIISKLEHFPLEVFKIKKYLGVFSSANNIKNDLRRHSKRLRWQLMRIYRNRCMIVHDGSHMPYIENILENLHFYVDDLLEFMITCIGEGIKDPDAMLSSARIKEKRKLDILGDKAKVLTNEEYLQVLL